GVELSATLNGVDVVTSPPGAESATAGAEVFVDHVAVLVRDIEASCAEWARVTGATAELIGLHPISNGGLEAARLDVGGRMIELLSPVAGVESPLAARLERLGEGPVALAMPAHNLEATLERLRASDIQLMFQDPHWLVHPRNPLATMIQLTPRVRH
ncbi:MAG: VOC family protein, partial [Actinomycetota bacterium]|nr:VOC family protein [Actinomycetota bacterium]